MNKEYSKLKIRKGTLITYLFNESITDDILSTFYTNFCPSKNNVNNENNANNDKDIELSFICIKSCILHTIYKNKIKIDKDNELYDYIETLKYLNFSLYDVRCNFSNKNLIKNGTLIENELSNKCCNIAKIVYLDLLKIWKYFEVLKMKYPCLDLELSSRLKAIIIRIHKDNLLLG
jgi:hypothetical protein